MPERVIDFLEAIEIEQEQRRLRARPAAAGEHIVDLAMEHRAVGKTGKRIEISELFKLFFGDLAVGNVLDCACKADNPSVIIGHRPACDHNVGDGSVATIDLDIDALRLSGAHDFRLGCEEFRGSVAAVACQYGLAGGREFGRIVCKQLVELGRPPHMAIAKLVAPVTGFRQALGFHKLLRPLFQDFLAPPRGGDIDANTDAAAVGGAALINPDPAVTPQMLLGRIAILLVAVEPFGEPFLLSPDRIKVMTAVDAGTNGVGETPANRDPVDCGVVKFEEFLVEKNIPSFGVKKPRVRTLKLIGHQQDRAIRPLAITVGLIVGCRYEIGQQFKIDLAQFLRRLGKLPLKELAHGCYAAISVMVVIVIVWLWSSQIPETACGEISP